MPDHAACDPLQMKRQTGSKAMSIWKTAIACSLAGAVMAGQAAAAPMPTNVAAMKAVVGDDTTQVYWRGGWGWGLGGLAAGAIIGGAIASTAPYGYYGGPYGSSYGYGYAPYYYGNAPGYAYSPYYAHPRYYRPYRPYYGNSYGYYRPYRAWHRPYYGGYW
jgi:hypothetical protein